MSEAHQKRAVEWFLVLHEMPFNTALRDALLGGTVADVDAPVDDEEPDTPSLYDTGLDASEGLWSRTGWAGRA